MGHDRDDGYVWDLWLNWKELNLCNMGDFRDVEGFVVFYKKPCHVDSDLSEIYDRCDFVLLFLKRVVFFTFF